MTPKQIERIQKKIKAIRKAIYDEKKLWGGYYDGRGLRYAPPALYVKIQDFKGGMTYFRWFHKNFPDDIGMPDFLFEWTIILFKNGKFKEAEKKAIQTYFSNIYLFDKFFDRPIIPIDNSENSKLHSGLADFLTYSKNQTELSDFAAWLSAFEKSEHFESIKLKYLEISIRLKTEDDWETRSYLHNQIWQLRGDE